jgi:hypothetical protein
MSLSLSHDVSGFASSRAVRLRLAVGYSILPRLRLRRTPRGVAWNFVWMLFGKAKPLPHWGGEAAHWHHQSRAATIVDLFSKRSP